MKDPEREHSSCSRKCSKREKKANKEWMTEEILELMTKRKAAKNTPRYHIINNEINVKIKAAKENYYSGLCKTIEDEIEQKESIKKYA